MDYIDFYYIVFPAGDRSKLCVVELPDAISYEIADYARASRKEFTDRKDAIEYARELADKHDLEFIGDDEGYLD